MRFHVGNKSKRGNPLVWTKTSFCVVSFVPRCCNRDLSSSQSLDSKEVTFKRIYRMLLNRFGGRHFLVSVVIASTVVCSVASRLSIAFLHVISPFASHFKIRHGWNGQDSMKSFNSFCLFQFCRPFCFFKKTPALMAMTLLRYLSKRCILMPLWTAKFFDKMACRASLFLRFAAKASNLFFPSLSLSSL